jgi:hypothetical protein
MESKTVLVTNKKLIARLTELWDGVAEYVMIGGHMWRVVKINDGEVRFFASAEEADMKVPDTTTTVRRDELAEEKADAKATLKKNK